MDKIEIFLSKSKSPGELHEEIAEKLNFPDYYGKNLDALNDCLSEIKSCNLNIYISDCEIENKTLDNIIMVFENNAKNNPNFLFNII